MKKLISTLILFICLFSSVHAEMEAEKLKLKQFVCDELPKMEGWCSKEKALNFFDLVLETKPDVCVEIGTYAGASALPVAMALKFLGNGVIICIDSWDKIECIKYFDPVEDVQHLSWWGKVNLNQIHKKYLEMVQKFELQSICITKKTTSANAAASIGVIDILYIDGNHSEFIVTQDVQLYLPKVRSGGYIWINDALWPTLQEAIDLVLESCEPIKLIDNGNCILFKKR